MHETSREILYQLSSIARDLRRMQLPVAASWLDRAAERIGFLETEADAAEPCAAEVHSWDHFRSAQLDPYWIRCTLYGEHAEHYDSNTGLRWHDATEASA